MEWLPLAEVDGLGPGPTGAELEAAAEAATGFEDKRVVSGVGVRDDGGDGAEAGVDALAVEGQDEGFGVAHADCAGASLELEGLGGCGWGDVDVDGVGELAIEVHEIGCAGYDACVDFALDGEAALLDHREPEAAVEDRGGGCGGNSGGWRRDEGADISEALICDLRTICNRGGCN